jgi:hypothetical protein
VNRAVPVVVSDTKSSFSRALTKLEASVFAPAVTSDDEERPQRRVLLRGRR